MSVVRRPRHADGARTSFGPLSVDKKNMPTLAKNKKAFFDYELQEKFEAGLVLTGAEVKAIRAGQVKLPGSYIVFHGEIPQVINMHISKYKHATDPNYVPDRTRDILLKKKEIAYLKGKLQEKGLTIVPLSLYTSGRHLKMEIGVMRGKKTRDKRSTVKKRELDRTARRALKGDY